MKASWAGLQEYKRGKMANGTKSNGWNLWCGSMCGSTSRSRALQVAEAREAREALGAAQVSSRGHWRLDGPAVGRPDGTFVTFLTGAGGPFRIASTGFEQLGLPNVKARLHILRARSFADLRGLLSVRREYESHHLVAFIRETRGREGTQRHSILSKAHLQDRIDVLLMLRCSNPCLGPLGNW